MHPNNAVILQLAKGLDELVNTCIIYIYIIHLFERHVSWSNQYIGDFRTNRTHDVFRAFAALISTASQIGPIFHSALECLRPGTSRCQQFWLPQCYTQVISTRTKIMEYLCGKRSSRLHELQTIITYHNYLQMNCPLRPFQTKTAWKFLDDLAIPTLAQLHWMIPREPPGRWEFATRRMRKFNAARVKAWLGQVEDYSAHDRCFLKRIVPQRCQWCFTIEVPGLVNIQKASKSYWKWPSK